MVEIIDTSKDPFYAKIFADDEDSDFPAKTFAIDDNWIEFGIENEAGYVHFDTWAVKHFTPDVLAAIQKLSRIINAIVDLRDTMRMVHEVRDEYVSGVHPMCEVGHKVDFQHITILENQDYFSIPQDVAEFIADLKVARDKKPDGYVYILRSDSGYWKIGRSVNPADRLKTFSVKLPFVVSYEIVIPSPDYKALESELHNRFAYCWVDGEWFELTDGDIADLKREFENVAERFNG